MKKLLLFGLATVLSATVRPTDARRRPHSKVNQSCARRGSLHRPRISSLRRENKDNAAVLRLGHVRGACRVVDERACRVFTSAVAEHARKHKDFFRAGVHVERGESRTGIDLDDLCLSAVCASPLVALPDSWADLLRRNVLPVYTDYALQIHALWYHVPCSLFDGS